MSRRDVVTHLGVLAVVVGVILTVVPGPLATAIDAVVAPLVDSVSPEFVLLGLVLTGLLIVVVRGFRHEPEAVSPLREPVEHEPRAPVVGDSFEDLLERATDPDRTRQERARERRRLEEGLGALARDAFALATDCDGETAAAAIEDGTWCDDRRATALLGGPEAPTPRLTVWLVDLLRSEHAYRRRVRHAVAAIDRLTSDDRAGAAWDDGSGPTMERADANDGMEDGDPA